MIAPGMQKIQEQRQKIKNSLVAGLVPGALRSLQWEQMMLEATQRANHKATFGEDPAMPEEGDGAVNVDSPTTVNHYYCTPNGMAARPGMGPVAKFAAGAAIGSALLGGGAGLGLLIPSLLKPDAPIPSTGDTAVKYSLSLGSPE